MAAPTGNLEKIDASDPPLPHTTMYITLPFSSFPSLKIWGKCSCTLKFDSLKSYKPRLYCYI